MHYEFKQAVFLAGKSFKKGVHEVNEKAENDPHFLKFVSAGFIVDADAQKTVAPKTLKERSEALLNRLHGKKKSVAPVSQSVNESVKAETMASPEVDDVDEEVSGKPKHSKKKDK